MPRFDLYRRADGPGYLLDVQADHLYALPTRIVVPLLPETAELPALRDLNPILSVGEESLAMMTHYLAAVPLHAIGRPVGSLQAQADAITQALDILLTGF